MRDAGQSRPRFVVASRVSRELFWASARTNSRQRCLQCLELDRLRHVLIETCTQRLVSIGLLQVFWNQNRS